MRMNGSGLVVLAVAIAAALGAGADMAAARPTGDTVPTVSRNCSADYGGKPATCVSVACDAKFESFLGTWRGKFHAYVRKQSTPGHPVFRPYDESVAYDAADCLRNAANGDVFIVGHETDHYPQFGTLPAKVEHNLLITGRHANGTPYLRTVGSEGTYDYKLAFQDKAANLSIWQLHLPAANGQPPMTFTTVDGRDWNATAAHRRDVTVSMRAGPAATPYWQGVIAYGWHARQG